MISIKDELLQRVVNDFDTMLNATIERMKEHQEEKAEITLKLTIELTKESILDNDKEVPVDVPHFSHKVRSKWTGGKDFEGAIVEPLVIIGQSMEEYHLVRRKDAQVSLFDME